MEKEKGVTTVTVENGKVFVFDVLKSIGTPEELASLCADVLIEADIKGHSGYGLNILHKFVKGIERDLIVASATPNILSESASTAWVDGNNGLGPVVADFCMKLAIQKAKECGFGVVSTKGSNICGILGYFSEYALKQNCIGLAFTNSDLALVPVGAKEAGIGANAIAFAAPSHDNDYFSLDMATSTVAGGKIEVYRRKRLPLEHGWALNERGIVETDYEIANKKLLLIPLGGSRSTSAFKGYGLSLMAATLCGILSGSRFGPSLPPINAEQTDPADLGHCFMAINIDNFAPYFQDRLADLLIIHRKCELMDASKPVMVAGDPSRIHRKKVQTRKGIMYSQQQINDCQILASRLKIRPLQCKTSS